MGVNTTEVQLDKLRHFKFSHNALADLDMALAKETGKGLFATFMSAQENEDPTFVYSHGITRLLIWAGLKWEDSSLTPNIAYDLLDHDKAEPYKEAAEKAWMALMTSKSFSSMLGGDDAVKKLELAMASP